MRLQGVLLGSSVARRLLLIFVFCALVPLGVISFVTFDQVTKELYAQSQKRLHQVSKAAALTILGRLLACEADLVGLASQRESSTAATVEGGSGAAKPLRERFAALAFVQENGRQTPLLSRVEGVPDLSPKQRAHLASGKTLLVTVRGPGEAPRPLLMRRLEPGDPRGVLLVGQPKLGVLLDIASESAMPPLAEFCVLDEHHEVLACSVEGEASIPASVVAELDSSPSGHFDWTHDDVDYVARYWSVFIEPNFLAETLTLILAEPKEVVLAPIAGFRTTFPSAVLACFLIVSLLSLHQIRRSLDPLDALREGTRLITERNFDVQISIDSGDEFEELAASFNTMAKRLSEQFDSLAAMIDIDRAILSALDVGTIASTLLTRIRDLYACDAVAVLLTSPDDPEALHAYVAHDPAEGSELLEVQGFSAKECRQLHVHRERLLVRLDASRPAFLEPLAVAGIQVAVLLPLFVKGELAGAVALGHRDSEQHDPERLIYARQLADQAAIALTNVVTIEENRVLAYYDRLTGLPNRLLFKERFEQALKRAERHELRVATCLLDLDGFKRVNETLGYDAGDRLLKEASERISRIPGTEHLARLGGDEFVILLTDLPGIEDAARVAQDVVSALKNPFAIDEQEFHIGVSIGIAVYPFDGTDLESILRNGDAAMHHAKDEGGNGYRFYTRSMNDSTVARLGMENGLRRALANQEFRLHYQPIVDVVTRTIIGIEALIRWQHPERGVVHPGDFIALAEETGLILPIGEWALRAACAQNGAWQHAGLPPIRVAVNLSSRQFRDESLIDIVQRALFDADLDARHLSLELTESVLMDADDRTQRTLMAFKELGVQLSIDDFGTGYSSLSYLKHLPLDHLKIDRVFISNVTTNPEDAAITQAVIAMAHGLRLGVVAEGVETEAQLSFLREHGCEAAQGYLFARPLSAAGVEKLLREAEFEPG